MAYKADSIFKNQFFNFAMQLLNIIFPIIAIPYTTRLFGPELLGEVNFANSIVSYFVIIASAGIPVYATREIAKARDNNALLRKKFKEIIVLQILFTLISVLIYAALVFSVPTMSNQKTIYLFLGIQILSNAFNFVWFIQGVEKYRYAAIATFISKFINVIMVFMLLRKREDYFIYAFIMGITVFINAFANMYITFKLIKNFECKDKVKVDYGHLKVHVASILIFFLSDVAVKVYTAMDQTMLGILDSTESVGYYSMSIRLEKVILTLVTSIAVVMIPRISNSIKNNKMDDVRKYIGMSVNLMYLIAIPAVFGIFAIGENIIPVFLGEEFLQSTVIFKLVSLLLIIIGLSNVFGMQVMIPFGKEKKFTVILSTAAVVNFVVNLILIPKLSYFGATYATLLAELLVTVWMYVEVRKLVGNIPQIFNVWKIVIPSLAFYIVINLFIKTTITSDIVTILVSVPVAGLIYILGLVIMKEELTMSGVNLLLSKVKNKKILNT